ncbi:ATP-binding protein [Thiocystis violacea]|uniref:ATP-binding protein n=1 Tax=Thiocystis violacea TaxID=13725 RepID=UPI00190405AE|nr:ATP-binding protein [Thiocystis violacea]MBK1716085.1 hypothetical protein [Thiocystis violacea]
MTLGINPSAPPFDIGPCDAEPVPIPGAIQPHGVLLALQGPDSRIIQVAASCEARLGIAPAELLGCELASVLGAALAEAVRQALIQYRERSHAPCSIGRQPLGDRVFNGYLHESDGFAVLELEPAPDPSSASEILTQAVSGFGAVHDEPERPAKLRLATTLIRRLTGYDRVMIYRFDEDWRGEVVAEARREDLEPYLGRRYPASDFPSPARRLCLINPTRVIVDVDAEPSPLLPELDPIAGRPLDLSRALLRGVSPAHLEYPSHPGVRASLTVSLIRDGRLWGLIACHHGVPRRVSSEMRQIADWMGRDLATQIALAEASERRRHETPRQACRDRLIHAMRGEARLATLLTGPALSDLLGAVGADGVALIDGTEIVAGGVTPDPERILDIVAGLTVMGPSDPSGLFASDCPSEHLDGAAELAASAAGVVLFPLDAARPLKLIWFRGEPVREATRGDDPCQAMEAAAWTRIVPLHGKPWRAEELESARQLGALIDIEWRKQVEDALRANKALMKDVLDALTAHLAVLDDQGVITLVNAAWRRFAKQNGGNGSCQPGTNYLAVCRRAIRDTSDPYAQASLQGIQAVLDRQQPLFELQYPCDSPTEARWFEMRAFPLSGARPGALIAHEEITERKGSEQALREAAQRKDEFLAMLGHELRNPLAPIRHAAEILSLSPTPERVTWAASLMTRQISHLTRLVDDLLDVSRISLGKLRLQRQPFDLRQAVERAVEQSRPRLDRQAQQLAIALPRTPVMVDGDLDRLTQVFVNLLVNAAKFSGSNMTVFLTLETLDEAARVEVRDQGVGMAASLLSEVFTPFSQGEQTIERPHGGLGLGLSLVKGLVELHGGEVRAASPGLGEGSTFSLSLPLDRCDSMTPDADAERRSEPVLVILVVDDQRDVADSCAMLLRCLGQRVHTAHDGPAALDLAERIRPDLILLDIGLPGMDGYEVARRLRDSDAGRNARLVALTGYGREDVQRQTRAAGFDEHLLKPVATETLIALLGRCS